MFTITRDNEDLHIRAIVSNAGDLQDLIDKLIAQKEKLYGRQPDIPSAVQRSAVSGNISGDVSGITNSATHGCPSDPDSFA